MKFVKSFIYLIGFFLLAGFARDVAQKSLPAKVPSKA